MKGRQDFLNLLADEKAIGIPSLKQRILRDKYNLAEKKKKMAADQAEPQDLQQGQQKQQEQQKEQPAAEVDQEQTDQKEQK